MKRNPPPRQTLKNLWKKVNDKLKIAIAKFDSEIACLTKLVKSKKNEGRGQHSGASTQKEKVKGIAPTSSFFLYRSLQQNNIKNKTIKRARGSNNATTNATKKKKEKKKSAKQRNTRGNNGSWQSTLLLTAEPCRLMVFVANHHRTPRHNAYIQFKNTNLVLL